MPPKKKDTSLDKQSTLRLLESMTRMGLDDSPTKPIPSREQSFDKWLEGTNDKIAKDMQYIAFHAPKTLAGLIEEFGRKEDVTARMVQRALNEIRKTPQQLEFERSMREAAERKRKSPYTRITTEQSLPAIASAAKKAVQTADDVSISSVSSGASFPSYNTSMEVQAPPRKPSTLSPRTIVKPDSLTKGRTIVSPPAQSSTL